MDVYYCVLFSSIGLGLGLDFMPGWLVVMHTYLYCFPLSLYPTHVQQTSGEEIVWQSATVDYEDTVNSTTYEWTTTHLRGGTEYSLRLQLRYSTGYDAVWPLPPDVALFRTANDHRQYYTLSFCHSELWFLIINTWPLLTTELHCLLFFWIFIFLLDVWAVLFRHIANKQFFVVVVTVVSFFGPPSQARGIFFQQGGGVNVKYQVLFVCRFLFNPSSQQVITLLRCMRMQARGL